MNKYIKTWLFPLLIAAVLFAVVRPALAQTVPGGGLSEYLASGSVEVGTEDIEGYQQIYYLYQDKKTFITQGSVNSTLPDSHGDYIVYRKSINGLDQIFLYDILADSTVQLTMTGNNTNPRVDEGKVVWEGWDGETWQIFYFNGESTKQITDGVTSVNPDIDGGNIVYARRDASGWRTVLLMTSNNKTYDVQVGDEAKYPRIKNGKIFLGDPTSQKEFPLTPNDLERLGLPGLLPETPLPSSAPVIDAAQISEELSASSSASQSATESAQFESPTATPSSTPRSVGQ